jgi:hypothetical protein
VCLLAVGALAGFAAPGRDRPGAAASQEAPPPLVGAWRLASGRDRPGRPDALATFAADGLVLVTGLDGTTQHGVWRATGARVADFTLEGLVPDEAGRGLGAIRQVNGTVAVDAAGEAFTGRATITVRRPNGTAANVQGPLVLRGERIGLAPMAPPGAPGAGTPTAAGTPPR